MGGQTLKQQQSNNNNNNSAANAASSTAPTHRSLSEYSNNHDHHDDCCVSEENRSFNEWQDEVHAVRPAAMRVYQHAPYDFHAIDEDALSDVEDCCDYQQQQTQQQYPSPYPPAEENYSYYAPYMSTSYPEPQAPAPYSYYPSPYNAYTAYSYNYDYYGAAAAPCPCPDCVTPTSFSIPSPQSVEHSEEAKPAKVVRPSRHRGTAQTHSVACYYHKQGLACKMGSDCWYRHDDPSDVSLRETPCHYGAKCLAGHAQFATKAAASAQPTSTPAQPSQVEAPRPALVSAKRSDVPCAYCGVAGEVYTQEIPMYVGGTHRVATHGHCTACKSTFAL